MQPTRREIGWAETIFEALFPVTEDAPIGASEVPMGRFYADQVAACPALVALLYRVTLALIYLLMPLLMLGRPRTFRALSTDQRRKLLEQLYASRVYALRQTVTLIKMIAGTGFLGFPEVQRQFGVEHEDATPPIEGAP